MQPLFLDKITHQKIDGWMKTIREDLQNSISEQVWFSTEIKLRHLIEHYEGDKIWVDRLRVIITDKKKFRTILLKAHTFGKNVKQVSNALTTLYKRKNSNIVISEITAMMNMLNRELAELHEKHTQPRLKHVLVTHLEKIHNYLEAIEDVKPIVARKVVARLYRYQNGSELTFGSPVESSDLEAIRSMLTEKIDRTISDEGSLYASKFRLVLMLSEKNKIPSGGGYLSEKLGPKEIELTKPPTKP